MKRLLLGVVFLGMLAAVIAGCEGKPSGDKPGTPAYTAPTRAEQINDGADKYFPMQMADPVNDKNIEGKFYVDLDGKRIYFSSQESIEEFNKDPEKYIQKMSQLWR